MNKTKPLTMEARLEVKRLMTASITAYLKELSRRYFKHPTESEARQLLLECNAEALHNVMADEPLGRAAIASFANELLDKEQQ